LEATVCMKYEIEAASGYWLAKLDRTQITEEQSRIFLSELQRLMCNKFANHWYEDEPTRGQGFRSLVCDYEQKFVDSMLLSAATAAGFNFYELWGDTKGLRMWVDPGEVEVRNVSPPYKRTVIFQSTKAQPPSSISPPLAEDNSFLYYSQPDDSSLSNYYHNQPIQYSEYHSEYDLHYDYDDTSEHSSWPHSYESAYHDVSYPSEYFLKA